MRQTQIDMQTLVNSNSGGMVGKTKIVWRDGQGMQPNAAMLTRNYFKPNWIEIIVVTKPELHSDIEMTWRSMADCLIDKHV